PGRRWFYRLLSIGYSDTETVRENHRRSVWWCAVIILPIMVSVHSVYGWVFGLNVGRPGWYNPLQAPYFVLGAIVSGFSAIIIVAALVRRVFRWEEFLPPRMFKGLGIFLGFIVLLYIYFLFSEYLTGLYASPEAEYEVFSDLLWGRFRFITWATLVGGLLIPFWMLFIQGVNPKICSIRLTVTAAVLVNLALWTIRYLIVVPTYYHPYLPYKIAPYSATLTEWTVMLGTWAFAIFFFAILVKLFPVIELPEDYKIEREEEYCLFPKITLPGRVKKALILLTLLVALGLIAYGIGTRELDYAPPKWLTGIFLLCMIPLEVCILQSRDEKERLGGYGAESLMQGQLASPGGGGR
ncbi:MAG: NrfD/PsrC family molybdoenzyme membrane anchor subunit, partial [Nitrospinota bacterium]